MALNEALLPEFDHEMANTRRTLERVPDEKLGWKPHEKSGTMGWLAGHVAGISSWPVMTIDHDSLDIAPKGGAPAQAPAPASRKALLELFDKNAAEGRAALARATDKQLLGPWSLLSGGQTLFTMPRIAVLRGFVMNHLIHHRAQLTVYLRLNNIPVPALYGPSADENKF
jgi:uncharacterized damage-inducible protein DinB